MPLLFLISFLPMIGFCYLLYISCDYDRAYKKYGERAEYHVLDDMVGCFLGFLLGVPLMFGCAWVFDFLIKYFKIIV
jgi:hypothetical protein